MSSGHTQKKYLILPKKDTIFSCLGFTLGTQVRTLDKKSNDRVCSPSWFQRMLNSYTQHKNLAKSFNHLKTASINQSVLVRVLFGGVCLVLSLLVSRFHFAQGSLVVCSLYLWCFWFVFLSWHCGAKKKNCLLW